MVVVVTTIKKKIIIKKKIEIKKKKKQKKQQRMKYRIPNQKNKIVYKFSLCSLHPIYIAINCEEVVSANLNTHTIVSPFAFSFALHSLVSLLKKQRRAL